MRHSYKTALRAKGIRPIPRDPAKLRSSLTIKGEAIDATASALAERRVYKLPVLARTYQRRCVAEGDMYCNHNEACPLSEIGL